MHRRFCLRPWMFATMMGLALGALGCGGSNDQNALEGSAGGAATSTEGAINTTTMSSDEAASAFNQQIQEKDVAAKASGQ